MAVGWTFSLDIALLAGTGRFFAGLRAFQSWWSNTSCREAPETLDWTRRLTLGGSPWGDGAVVVNVCGMSEPPVPVPSHPLPSVSVENQIPEDLFEAMREFIRLHPQWDQYRLMQAALAGFLFQHGATDRAVARHYLDGLFQHGHAIPRSLPPLGCQADSVGFP